jgi:hypothetical protein
LFLTNASISGVTNEIENASSISGGRQTTARERGKGSASRKGRSRTTRGGLAQWFAL